MFVKYLHKVKATEEQNKFRNNIVPLGIIPNGIIFKKYMESEALYYRLGEENLKLLVDRFYDLVFTNPQISHLFKTDKEVIKKKQELFLTQFLGGPALYSDQYGHPRLRARHLP